MKEQPSADLLVEVAKVQRRKDLMDFRDLIEKIETTYYDKYSYSNKNRPAEDFKKDLLNRLQDLS